MTKKVKINGVGFYLNVKKVNYFISDLKFNHFNINFNINFKINEFENPVFYSMSRDLFYKLYLDIIFQTHLPILFKVKKLSYRGEVCVKEILNKRLLQEWKNANPNRGDWCRLSEFCDFLIEKNIVSTEIPDVSVFEVRKDRGGKIRVDEFDYLDYIF